MNQKCHIKIILLNYMPLPVTKRKNHKCYYNKIYQNPNEFSPKKAPNMCALVPQSIYYTT